MESIVSMNRQKKYRRNLFTVVKTNYFLVIMDILVSAKFPPHEVLWSVEFFNEVNFD